MLHFSTLFILAQTVASASGTEISGMVRAVEDGRPLASVVVEIPADARWTVTDTLGSYRLGDLEPGTHQLRYRAEGRLPLVVTARVPAAGRLRLDVEMTQRPTVLPPMVVRADPQMVDGEPALGIEAFRAGSSAWVLRDVPGVSDLRQALAIGAGAATRGDGGALHLEGGPADGALLTIDDFPLYGGTHFGSAWSALNPDAIAGIAFRPGGTPAIEPGRLSGTVAVRSSLLGGGAGYGAGAVTPGDVRQLVQGDLAGGSARFLLSGRRSVGEFVDFDPSPAVDDRNGFGDWLAAGSIAAAGGRLRALTLRSEDHLAFGSRAAADDYVSAAAPNILEWDSHTDGIAWEKDEPTTRVGIFLWRAGTSSEIVWRDPERPTAVESRFEDRGLRVRAEWTGADLEVGGALDLRHLESSYRARLPGASPTGELDPLLDHRASPTILTAAAGLTWYWSERAEIGASVQAMGGGPNRIAVAPALAIAVRPFAGFVLRGTAGRAHQFAQSLHDEESFLGTLVGLELPAATSPEIPLARSDRLGLGLTWRAVPQLHLSVDGYVRRFDHLLLPALASRQPFPAALPPIGSGTAAGADLRAAYVGGPVELRLALGAAGARRTGGGTEFAPGFQRSRFINAVLVARPDLATSIGVTFTAGAGQPATPVSAVDWRPYAPLNDEGELSGTPTMVEGALNADRLPAVRRLDLSLRRDWRLRAWPSGPVFRTTIALENVLDHRNALALTADPSGAKRLLHARPRTLHVELGWRF